MTRTILVPLDFGEEADRALPVGRSLADATGARLEGVVVSGAASADDDAEELLWHARHAGVRLDAIHVTADDHVAAGILAEATARDATLCVATHVRGPAADLVFHSVANELLRRDGPIVLVGPEVRRARPHVASLLACVDDSPSSAGVAAAACAWAAALDVKVRVLQVVDAAEDRAAGRPAAAAWAALQADGIDAHWDLMEGDDAAEGILVAAAEMDAPLVVVGGGGPAHRAGPGHPPLGAVARAVVRHAPHPVLVVPAPG
ncbi:MAG TPA: universal stress protein [Acidimicrobiales bacterium]|nr:universal stress protein [Acidimicrobiales bacterium]